MLNYPCVCILSALFINKHFTSLFFKFLNNFSHAIIQLINFQLMKIFSIVFSILITLISCQQSITPVIMDQLLSIVDEYFFAANATYSVAIKKFLRGAFHDCMGGCDASLNLYNTDNRGLEGLVAKVAQAYSFKSPYYSTIANYLSRADFLVLAEERALAWGMKNGGESPKFQNNTPSFIYGRASNPNGVMSDDKEGNFPDGRANWTLPSTDTNHPTTVLEGLLNGLAGVNETDIITLLGLHGAGGLNMNNSGFQGPWLQFPNGTNVQNIVNNNYYVSLFGVNALNSTMLQIPSNESRFFVPSELAYLSPDPQLYKIQWVAKGKTDGKIFINADLLIYYDFVASSNGTAPGKYCPQGANTTLFDCRSVNSTYLPLSTRATQGFSYAKNNTKFINDLVPAFLKLVNVTNQFTNPLNLNSFYPQIVCQNGQQVCRGDIFFTGCGITLGSC